MSDDAKKNTFTLGLDFGSDSVRALLTDARDGREVAQAVAYYPRWKSGRYCNPRENRFRQHPLDYLESMTQAVRDCLAQAPELASRVAGIGVDTTGSTPVLADRHGTPLALLPAHAEDPDACFILWKDHTAIEEAEQINTLARTWGGEDFTKYVGGIYSSEWFWAKIAHVLKTNPAIGSQAWTILEHCDWIPALLCGINDAASIKRSRCAAGHKAMWHKDFGGYPADAFLARLHPELPRLKANLGTETWTAEHPAGRLGAEWAGRLGLPAGIPVAVGAFDAHMGAAGAGVDDGTFLRIMGTSTCDIMVSPLPGAGTHEKLIPGICGQVDGSVIADHLGLEAGQSAYGDIFAWFKNLLAAPLREQRQALAAAGTASPAVLEALQAAEDQIIPWLDREASRMAPGGHGVLAVDWFNGRRTPDADQSLKGALTGLSLGTDAPSVYRALVEAAAFGSRAIVERFKEQGVKVAKVGAIGGVAKKSALVMQVLADVLDMEIQVRSSDQCCALGAAIFAAVAAGLHPNAPAAMKAMASPVEKTYKPDPVRARQYDSLYRQYRALGSFVESQTRSARQGNKG